jgi:segregation and condensation protein A
MPTSSIETSKNYEVNLGVFQGPLDLLLFLIRKKKIDINDIPIAIITKEYLEYLDKKDKINIANEGQFLLTAALLIYIKSRMLLPSESENDDEADPRQTLVHRLLDYQKIKAACEILRNKEDEHLPKWHRTFLPPLPSSEELELIEVSLFDLAECFFNIMKKKERENIQLIQGKEYSIEKKMNEMVAIVKEKGYLDFINYFETRDTLEEALVSFFCLLELIKAGILFAVQENLFKTIKIWPRKEVPNE